MNFHTECRNILLFEFSGEMSLDERSLEIALAIARVLLAKDEKVKRISTDRKSDRNNSLWGLRWLTFPVPPSPTSTSLKLGICEAASAILLTASR
jgi:hypothetical protein